LTPAPIEKDETATNGKTSSETAAGVKKLEEAQKEPEKNGEAGTNPKVI